MPDPQPKLITVRFADRCCWRAMYIYVRRRHPTLDYLYEHKVAHVGIDPRYDVIGPQCFGSFFGFQWRFGLPHQPWNSYSVQKRWRLGLFLYRVSSNFYHSLDGRNG